MANKSPTTAITLKAPHEHGGVLHKAGAVITVAARQADWLIRAGAAAALPELTPATQRKEE